MIKLENFIRLNKWYIDYFNYLINNVKYYCILYMVLYDMFKCKDSYV